MWDLEYPDSKIMVVDDEKDNLVLMDKLLKKLGYKNILTINDPFKVCQLYLEFEPDLIILDIIMPELDGYQVMEQLKKLIPQETYLPVLVLTADNTSEARLKSLWMGAKDVLTKPFDISEIFLRIRNLLKTRYLHLQLQNQNTVLEHKVMERTFELQESHLDILVRLARAAEYRDDDTGEHTWRVARISSVLAKALGLPDEHCELMLHAARLHDVGKIAIPDSVLLKPGKLTNEEFDLMKTHTTIGAEILSKGRSKLLQMAECIALTHHEKWNGFGYPKKLKEEEIPIEGRIVSIADVFDALTHDRPYKKAWPIEEAVAEIQSQSGKQFDPNVVKVFMENLDEIVSVKKELDDHKMIKEVF